VQIIFSLRASGFRVYDAEGHTVTRALGSAIATGPSAHFAVIDAHDTAATVGVSFHPGCAAPFVGAPPSTFTETDVELGDVWGRADCDRLHGRLLEAGGPDVAFRVLEDALLQRLITKLLPPAGVRHALEVFTRTAHTASIADVRDQVGLSHRRFVDVFEHAVGLTPKRFCRVRRFQQVLQRAHAAGRVAWTDVALACGYSDQSHLVHDFRAFAGITPSAWMAARTAHQNHVRLR
jgi:AraC-like DNA-binding protein